MGELADELDQLVQRFLEALGPVEEYAEGLVDAADVRETAAVTLQMLTSRLAGHPPSAEHERATRDVGVRRARQGVPQAALFEAARMDFQVIWAALVDLAGEGRSAVLVRNLSRLYVTVEDYVNEMQDAYVAEQAVLARDSRLYSSRFVAQLFIEDPQRARPVEEIARGLGVDPNALFEVVQVGAESAATFQASIARGRLPGDWFVIDRSGGYVLFREQRPHGKEETRLFDRVDGGFVSGVAGLGAVPQAASSAARLGSFADALGGGLVGWDRGWLPVAADQVRNGIDGFGASVWRALDFCTEHERVRLVETVVEYCRTGSVKETAASLYCHRNTVVNRLHTFRNLSDLDVFRPMDACAALLALGQRPQSLLRVSESTAPPA